MTEASTNRWSNPNLWGGLVFFILVLVALVYAWVRLQDWLYDEQQVPLQQVLVAGELTYLKKSEVNAAIRKAFKGSFFELDIDKAHEVVEGLPWVYRASLRKEWPSTLKVFVVEQVPVAHWNDDLILNQYGGVFQAKMPDGLTHLPKLYGPEGSELTAMQGYKAMQALLKHSGLAIEELLLSERFAWHLRLQGDVKLRLGRSEFIDRLQRFVDLYPLLAKDKRAVDYVDLRYDMGLAVGFKEQQDSES